MANYHSWFLEKVNVTESQVNDWLSYSAKIANATLAELKRNSDEIREYMKKNRINPKKYRKELESDILKFKSPDDLNYFDKLNLAYKYGSDWDPTTGAPAECRIAVDGSNFYKEAPDYNDSIVVREFKFPYKITSMQEGLDLFMLVNFFHGRSRVYRNEYENILRNFFTSCQACKGIIMFS